MVKDKTKRIYLWSGPRNISTALMYSFAQRSDTKVYDEPLYAHYLSGTNARKYHPGAKDVLATMENNGEKVIEMMTGKHDKPVVFFKNMTHHLLNLDPSFMKNVVNIILTRDPIEMLPSFAKVIDNPTMDDVGYMLQLGLVKYLQKNDSNPIIIDSKQILLDPKNSLKDLCNTMDIPWDEKMLKWKAQAREEDGIWAKYWYGNIHKSTQFMKYEAKTGAFPQNLKPLLDKCIPYYNELIKMSNSTNKN